MDPTTQFIVGLFLLVAGSVIVGELLNRIGQAALVGQLAVGIVLGPTVLAPFLGFGGLSTQFAALQFLATFLILMTAGLAVTPNQVYATGASATILGITMFVVPFVSGAVVVHLLFPSMAWSTGLFVSLTISITALPVLGVMLREFDLLDSRFGTFLLNGSLVNELAAVTTFSILLRVANGSNGSWTDATIAVVTVGLFLSSVLTIHMALRTLRHAKVWDRMVARFRGGWRSRESGFALLMSAGLGAALYSQALGLTFLVGAFYAGLLVTPESAGRREHRALTRVFDTVTWGFFIPLFFALVGFGMDLRSLVSSWTTLLSFALLCGFAFFSKVAIGGLVVRSLGWSPSESFGAGFLVASRGAVELAMAVILLSIGVFSTGLFTIVAGVGVATTFLSPIGARRFLPRVTRLRREPADERVRPWLGSSLPPPPLSDADAPAAE